MTQDLAGQMCTCSRPVSPMLAALEDELPASFFQHSAPDTEADPVPLPASAGACGLPQMMRDISGLHGREKAIASATKFSFAVRK